MAGFYKVHANQHKLRLSVCSSWINEPQTCRPTFQWISPHVKYCLDQSPNRNLCKRESRQWRKSELEEIAPELTGPKWNIICLNKRSGIILVFVKTIAIDEKVPLINSLALARASVALTGSDENPMKLELNGIGRWVWRILNVFYVYILKHWKNFMWIRNYNKAV